MVNYIVEKLNEQELNEIEIINDCLRSVLKNRTLIQIIETYNSEPTDFDFYYQDSEMIKRLIAFKKALDVYGGMRKSLKYTIPIETYKPNGLTL